MTTARSFLQPATSLLIGAVLLAAPLIGLAWLLGHPRQNLEVMVPRDHFVIVTNVALLALAVAAVILRSALQLGHARGLLLSAGFLILAGLFSIHGHDRLRFTLSDILEVEIAVEAVVMLDRLPVVIPHSQQK